MASSSSEPAPKIEYGTGGDGSGGGGGGGGGEISEVKLKGPDEVLLYRGLKRAKKERGCTAKERISKMPPCTAGKRSSIYRGVTRHRWTGRYEAHLWDKSTWNQNQNKKGKQVYLGAYDDEEAAARAYDLAALKYWGPGTLINFPVTDYARDLEEMQNLSREDYLASLRRKSSGFSRGISKLRPLSSRWDSQFGHMPGSDYLNNINYGDDASTEHAYAGGFCIDRKIDLTSYIKWWGVNKSKTNQSEVNLRPSKDKQIEEITGELKAPDWSVKHTEPYEMPKLGLNIEVKKNKSSVLSLLSKSVAFKTFEEKASRMKEVNENDENENKNIIINKLDRGKGIEEESGFGMNIYSLTPFITAPLLSSYNSVDTLPDPVLWGTLVPTLTTGSSVTNEVTKNEPSSGFTFFNPEG